MNRNHLWVLLLFGFAGIFSIALLAANALPPSASKLKNQKIESLPALAAPEVTIADPARGSPSAKLVIVEFASYGCAHCKETEATLKEFLLAHPYDVRIVWKDFPIGSDQAAAKEAAEAARCAERAGKFWEYHDALMSAASLPTAGELGAIAETTGISSQNFLACMGGDFTLPLIDRTFEEGQRLKIDGVPYFFLNNQRFSGTISREELEAALAAIK